MRPLDSNKHVSMYIVTHCTEKTSDKVYIFVVGIHKKVTYLARFWGKYGGTLTGIHGAYDQDEFQKLIDEKGTEGYKIVDNTEIERAKYIFGTYAEKIADYIDNIPRQAAGNKQTLS